jgi:pilus assembly protein Flp/PilA
MEKTLSALKSFVRDEDGVTAIEYGLIAALVAAVLVTAVGAVTGGLTTAFNFIAGKMNIS